MPTSSSQPKENSRSPLDSGSPGSGTRELLKSLESSRSQRSRRPSAPKSASESAPESASTAGGTSPSETPPTTFQQIRDVFESLAVALFLAFLFKTFEAEAFVIPTGSMAPTLKGRHKDVVCEECRFPFQTSASEEMDASTNRRNGKRVVAGTCPQCGLTQYFGDDVPSAKNDKRAPSFTGDRILVSKLTFDQRDLARWDVSVFRSPAEPKINFIKRIVGLPNERLRVQYGDLFVQKTSPSNGAPDVEDAPSDGDDSASAAWSPDVDLAETSPNGTDSASSSALSGADASSASADGAVDRPFEIARKDWKYLRQILQTVYDDDYPTPRLEALGWPSRWSEDRTRQNDGFVGWTLTKQGKRRLARRFVGAPVETSPERIAPLKLATEADVSPIAPDDGELSWLRYRHVVPSSNDWLYLAAGRLPPDVQTSGTIANNPRLIDDFSAYNAGISRRSEPSRVGSGCVWTDEPGDEFFELARKIAAPDGSEKTVCVKNPDGLGCNWVGDLAVSLDLTIEKTASESDKIAFDLVKGGVVFRCSLAPRSGTITLEIPGVPSFAAATTTFAFRENKTYSFVFANVDEEMRVVVDGAELDFGGAGRYDALTTPNASGVAALARDRDPTARDLAPVALGARGSVVRVERLKVLRDVYYIAAGRKLERWDSRRFSDFGTARCDRLSESRNVFVGEEDYVRFMSTPSAWRGYGRTKSALLRQGANQYVAFGDNSGFSLDSRLWATSVVPHYVDRKYLIGKAFYVYWPHGRPIPGTNLPYLPSFDKMRRVD